MNRETNSQGAMQADGERRKANGMTLAAGCKDDLIAAGKLALLDTLLASQDGTATIDDATAVGGKVSGRKGVRTRLLTAVTSLGNVWAWDGRNEQRMVGWFIMC